MKKLMIILISVMCFYTLNGYTQTSKQQEFAQLISTTPGITHTEWQTPLSLWVGVDLNSLGSPTKEKAQEVADIIANSGRTYLGHAICVSVYYGNFNKLAGKCEQ
jgi:hypothetical protein